MRDSIMLAAENLFAENGYNGTTVSQIAKEAGTATSNVYVYYPSKIEIAFAVFDPWLRQKIAELEAEVAQQPSPRAQLETLVNGLLCQIAADATGRTLTLVQALAMAKKTDHYSPELLEWTETRILNMIRSAFPRRDVETLSALAHVLMLCFDGVALRQNLHRNGTADVQAAQSILSLLLVPPPEPEDR
jgi:AcrR family transcriptional regulator